MSPVHVGPATYEWDGVHAYVLTAGPDVLRQPWDTPAYYGGRYPHFTFTARVDAYLQSTH